MPKVWATSGADLHLELTGPRVRAGLEVALREAIRGGRLRPGLVLPSSRALARDLGIARNTVADAYGQLVAEGWLATRQGAGTWVADRPTSAPRQVTTTSRSAIHVRYDLRAGVPDLSTFPRTAWLAATRRALSAAAFSVLGYSDPRGLRQLRTALTDYLARARGVVVTPDRVVVCSGFAEGLELLCEALRARGARTVAIEQYGHPRYRRLIEAKGLRPVDLTVDGGGAAIDQLAHADAALITPAHQFPIGVVLEAQRRRRAVQWAADSGALIIEDDYDGEFRYDRQAVGAMQALAPEHVVYAGSASKSLAPGLRLGWLVLPERLVDEVLAIKEQLRRLSSSIEQLTLAEFITCGGYDRHIRRARLAYRRRRDRLVAMLRREAPQVRVTGISAGLHALLELPPTESEVDIVARAAAGGLAIDGLHSFCAAADGSRPALVVGYAAPPDYAFTTAITRLCAVLPH
jgi:GntR family transcriptional regulator / MocR family aminotransferase